MPFLPPNQQRQNTEGKFHCLGHFKNVYDDDDDDDDDDDHLCDGLDAFLADEAQSVLDGFREQVHEIVLRFLLEPVAANVRHPRPDVRHPLEFLRVTEHHAAAAAPNTT